MHEMSLMDDVVSVAQRYAKESGADRVERVTIVVGEMRDIVDELVDGCFEFLSRGTLVEGAELVMKKVPLKARCGDCNLVFPVRLDLNDLPVCPDCGGRSLSLHSGSEFFIESIEVV